MKKSILLSLALFACSPQSDSSNNAVKFMHMIDPTFDCVPLSQNPFSYDSAMCKVGTQIIYAQAGGGYAPRFGVVFDSKPAEKKQP